jgi:pimeloyl-ACP methyl ester carboxylesterase
MADHAARFVAALGLSMVDGLGHSIGGYIAQTWLSAIWKLRGALSLPVPDRAVVNQRKILR